MHVRHFLGYARFGKPGVVELMNDLYRNEWRLLQNFFTPSLKLIEKTQVGARYYRKYDTSKTPYQRVLNDIDISVEKKQKLMDFYQTLDPFALRKTLVSKRKRISLYLKSD
jgi:hypothetical protein